MQSAQSDSASESIRDIGFKARTCVALHEAGCHTPASYVVPRSTLREIAVANDLPDALEEIFAQLDGEAVEAAAVLKHVRSAIRKQRIPEELATDLLKHHYQTLGESFVAVRASTLLPDDPEQHHAHLNVRGEHTTLESILQVWSELYTQRSLQLRREQVAEGIVVPAAILVQDMINAESSGVVLTKNIFSERKHERSHVVVLSRWGVSDHLDHFDDEELQQYDRFVVDVGAGSIVQRHVAHKHETHRRGDERFRVEKTSIKQRSRASLSDERAVALAQQAMQFKRNHLQQFQINWACDGDMVFCLDALELEREHVSLKSSRNSKKAMPASTEIQTATKLTLAAGNPQSLSDQLRASDGVGVMKSEFSVLKTGIHPQYLEENSKLELLEKTLHEHLKQFLEPQHGERFLLLRLADLTSAERAQLAHGRQYESHESNPALGLRGALFFLQHEYFLRAQLRAVQQLPQRLRAAVRLLIPHVREPSEFTLLQRKIVKICDDISLEQPELWLQIDTPLQLHDLDAFLSVQPTGISVALETLTAQLRSIDSDDHELRQQYPFDSVLAAEILETVAEHTADTPRQVELPSPNHRLIASAIKHGYQQLTIRPQHFQLARELTAQAEATHLER